VEEPGPLGGQYRPSSLRLIDEAVAAAQLIEPSLFEDEPPANGHAVAKIELETRAPDPRIENARNIVETNGVQKAPPRKSKVEAAVDAAMLEDAAIEAPLDESDSVPTEIVADEPEIVHDEGPTEPNRRRFASTVRREDTAPVRREESGLRMIGSHGRDRYETSGELVPRAADEEPAEPQRELVTIMPRRNTREVPLVVPPPEAEPAPPVEPPKPAPAPPRVSVAGGVAVPRREGPGPLAKILIAAAAVMVGAMVFAHCRKKASMPAGGGSNGSGSNVETIATTPGDAAPQAVGFGMDAASIDAGVATTAKSDARHAAVRPDAALVASTADAATPDASDRVKQARELLEQAQAALEDGDPEEALQLADRSITLRSTARAYLERARALQRLDRVDAALESVDSAMEIVANYAPAYYQRGMILWSARRYDEARTALSKYLELDPNGRDADTVKKLLQEPR
jgi:Flp pilus assembly protein TadD